MNTKELGKVLRRNGYKVDFRDREHGLVQWARTDHDVTLQVQLWSDGKHRASCVIKGREYRPVDFGRSVYQMQEAIRKSRAIARAA